MAKHEIKHFIDRGVKVYDKNKKACIVTDLDGTISLINGRSYYDDFKYDTDILNKPVITLISIIHDYFKHQLKLEDIELIILTGRAGTTFGRKTTQKWLDENNIYYDKLFMRKSGDFRKDYEVKSEIIQELQKEYNIIYAFDDRNSSAKAFRDNGITCLQVWEDDTVPKPCKNCKTNEELFKDKEVIYCMDCGKKLK